jgi:hypothetical protein
MDVLVAGFEPGKGHDVVNGWYVRRVALPDAGVARARFAAWCVEARDLDSDNLRIVWRGRVVLIAVRYQGMDEWWDDAWGDEDEDDGSDDAWTALFGGES